MTAENAPPISTEQQGSIAIWTLQRPDRRNSLSRDLLLALGRLARDAATDPSIRVVIVTGSGEKAFSAGADLKERRGMSENDVRVQLDLYRSELGALDRCPKPIVAAINGVALGGGLEIALACDLRVAASHAELGLPETSLGVIPGAGGTQRLPRLVGEARAKEMILLGRRVSAAQALGWGLVHRVTPPGVDVVADAVAWVGPLATGAPIAQAAALQAIDHALDVSLEIGLELEKASYDKVLVSEDRREGLEAFAAKRTPAFRGK